VYPIIEGEEYDPEDPDAEPAGPAVSIEESSPDQCLAAFREHGWVA
jgi:hypothetical protein